jgi:shikimate kinase
MNIALFGFMAVGKSVVGRLIAQRLDLTFIDLDDMIMNRAGKPITAIFEEDGETRFREIEKAVAREVSARGGQVIACGGGTLINSENLENLKKSSVMILLTADPETILKRVESDGDSRPLLKAPDTLERIKSLLCARSSSYLKAADIVVDTSYRTPEEVAEDILLRLKEVTRLYEGRDPRKRD